MNTFVIIGLVAIGLGLLVIVGAVAVIFLAPGRAEQGDAPSAAPAAQRSAAPAAQRSNAPAPARDVNPISQSPAAPRAAQPGDNGTPVPVPPTSGQSASLPPSALPPEEDPMLVNTGVLNVKDFDNFEELLAAADALTKPKERRE